MKTSEGSQVWVLLLFFKARVGDAINTALSDRTECVTFSSEEKLQKHLCSVILKVESERLDPEYYPMFKTYFQKAMYKEALEIWRSAQVENKTPLFLDASWEDKPQVVL